MPRLVLTKAITYREPPAIHFRRGIAQEIDEDTYHRLLHSGKLHDPDKDFQSIDPPRILPRLPAGTEILICREMGLGDVLMASIVARALAMKYPKLRFRFLTGSRYVPLLGKIPPLASIDPLISVNGRHPYVIDLRGLSERHAARFTMDRIDIFARYCGVEISDYRIPIPPVDTQSESFQQLEKLFHDKQSRRIAIALRGSTGLRSWPIAHCRRFAELALARGFEVIAIDGTEIEMPEGCLNLSGKLDLLDVKSVLFQCDFCISPDTGIVHLSEAVGTKCLALFTVIAPELRITHYKHVKAFARRDLPCFPCNHKGCPQFTCGNGILPEQVLDALDRWDSLPQISNPHESYAAVPAAVS